MLVTWSVWHKLRPKNGNLGNSVISCCCTLPPNATKESLENIGTISKSPFLRGSQSSDGWTNTETQRDLPLLRRVLLGNNGRIITANQWRYYSGPNWRDGRGSNFNSPIRSRKNTTNNNNNYNTSGNASNAAIATISANDGGSKGKEGNSSPPPPLILELPKQRPKRNMTSTERNFITPVRAMQDFLLKSSDLAGLRKTMRRSPHADEPPITVYWRRDVEKRADEIWGSLEDLKKEKHRRGQQNEEYIDGILTTEAVAVRWLSLSNIKRILKKYRKEYNENDVSDKASPVNTLLHGSGRIVLTAVTINAANFVIKLLAWSMTGSHSMFAEAIHSLADTINQIILAYGIHKSTQRANMDHPYGYANMRHVASLISGVGIFCVGAGLSFYHGITGLMGAEPIESLYWAFYILAGSFLSEGATLFLAVNSVRKRAKDLNITFKEYILRGRDPSLNVVILEDTAAVVGVGVAAICMGLTMYTSSPIPDSVGSLVIGGLLGGVASFIIYSNSAALVGRSIPRDNLEEINTELEQDVMVRAIHDVKGIDMGNMLVRYKAEVDFDGRELTKAYLDKQDIKQLMEEVKAVQTSEDMENFLLKHGENIVDTLGAEVDRIETRLKQTHPEIRHCDLEIL